MAAVRNRDPAERVVLLVEAVLCLTQLSAGHTDPDRNNAAVLFGLPMWLQGLRPRRQSHPEGTMTVSGGMYPRRQESPVTGLRPPNPQTPQTLPPTPKTL
ncbi:unnamed protein product [Lota lota]